MLQHSSYENRGTALWNWRPGRAKFNTMAPIVDQGRPVRTKQTDSSARVAAPDSPRGGELPLGALNNHLHGKPWVRKSNSCPGDIQQAIDCTYPFYFFDKPDTRVTCGIWRILSFSDRFAARCNLHGKHLPLLLGRIGRIYTWTPREQRTLSKYERASAAMTFFEFRKSPAAKRIAP